MRAQLVLAVLSLALASPVRAAKQVASAERRFLWSQANSQMASAHGASDFAEAAATYRRLVASGARNGPLFYNLGTALLRAGQYEEAVDALQRAERHVGSNPEITQNMLIALAGEDKEAEVSLPWHRFPLFWHYGLSAHLRMAVTAGALAAGCILLALWQLGSHTARQLMFVAWFVFALFGSSVITTLHQESQADRLTLRHASPREVGQR